MEPIIINNKKFTFSVPFEEISLAIKRIADNLNSEYKNKPNPIFLCVLNGSFMFTADLLKELTFNCRVCFIKLSSYKNDSTSGKVTEIIGLSDNIENKDVIILEDIIDTGLTVDTIFNLLKNQHPGSVKIITLFFKPKAFKKDFNIDQIGLHVPDKFLIGYGLDYNGLGRNYKDLYEMTE